MHVNVSISPPYSNHKGIWIEKGIKIPKCTQHILVNITTPQQFHMVDWRPTSHVCTRTYNL